MDCQHLPGSTKSNLRSLLPNEKKIPGQHLPESPSITHAKKNTRKRKSRTHKKNKAPMSITHARKKNTVYLLPGMLVSLSPATPPRKRKKITVNYMSPRTTPCKWTRRRRRCHRLHATGNNADMTCPAVTASHRRCSTLPDASRAGNERPAGIPPLVSLRLTLIPFKDYQLYMCTPSVLYWIRACSSVCLLTLKGDDLQPFLNCIPLPS
jgi:hypothetical protein